MNGLSQLKRLDQRIGARLKEATQILSGKETSSERNCNDLNRLLLNQSTESVEKLVATRTLLALEKFTAEVVRELARLGYGSKPSDQAGLLQVFDAAGFSAGELDAKKITQIYWKDSLPEVLVKASSREQQLFHKTVLSLRASGYLVGKIDNRRPDQVSNESLINIPNLSLLLNPEVGPPGAAVYSLRKEQCLVRPEAMNNFTSRGEYNICRIGEVTSSSSQPTPSDFSVMTVKLRDLTSGFESKKEEESALLAGIDETIGTLKNMGFSVAVKKPNPQSNSSEGVLFLTTRLGFADRFQNYENFFNNDISKRTASLAVYKENLQEITKAIQGRIAVPTLLRPYQISRLKDHAEVNTAISNLESKGFKILLHTSASRMLGTSGSENPDNHAETTSLVAIDSRNNRSTVIVDNIQHLSSRQLYQQNFTEALNAFKSFLQRR